MKAILEFNLPEEQEEFDQALHASRFTSNIDEFKHWLRSKVKYGNLPDHEHKIYVEVQEKFYEFAFSENI